MGGENSYFGIRPYVKYFDYRAIQPPRVQDSVEIKHPVFIQVAFTDYDFFAVVHSHPRRPWNVFGQLFDDVLHVLPVGAILVMRSNSSE